MPIVQAQIDKHFISTYARSNLDKVVEFHEKFGHPILTKPVINKALLANRLNFMQEELDEFKEAVYKGDIEGAFDAMLDLEYFIHGTHACMGTHKIAKEGFEVVHQANMTKLVKPENLNYDKAYYEGLNIPIMVETHDEGKTFIMKDAAGKVRKPQSWKSPVFTELFDSLK